MQHTIHVGYTPESYEGACEGDGRHTLIVDDLSVQIYADRLVAFDGVRQFPITTTRDVGCYERELGAIEKAAAELADVFGPPAAIVGLGELTALPAAYLRTAYGCFGTGHRVARLCRDKIEMKNAVSTAGLRVPAAWEISETTAGDSLDQISASSTVPLVLKPRASAASVGVHIFSGVGELAAHIRRHGVGDDAEVEEYIEADILHLDGVIRDDRLLFFSAGRYVTPPVRFESEKVALASIRVTDEQELNRARRFATAVVATIGLTDSVFHLEVFDTPDGLVFLEIAARSGGDGVRPHVRAAYDVNLADEALRACLNRSSRVQPDQNRAKLHSSGWLVTPIPTLGTFRVAEVPTIEHGSPGVVWSWLPAVGDVLDDSRVYSRTTGVFAVPAESDAELSNSIADIVDTYHVVMEPA